MHLLQKLTVLVPVKPAQASKQRAPPNLDRRGRPMHSAVGKGKTAITGMECRYRYAKIDKKR